MTTLGGKLKETGGRPSGFDYIRITLALCIAAFHSVIVCYGRDYINPFVYASWSPWRAPVCFALPSFFALSGFLVAGSLFRNTVPTFLTLRGVRIFPALICEVAISALIIGPLLTYLPLHAYFSDAQFYSYFLNMLGKIHFALPGMFEHNPYPHMVNQQLWTIPYELKCYISLTLLALLGIVQKPRTFIVFFVVLTLGIAIYGNYWTSYLVQFGPVRWAPDGLTCVLAFIAGVLVYVWREKIPHSLSLFLIALALAGVCLELPGMEYFSALPIAYVTMWLGLQNPRKLFIIAGADYSYGVYLYSFVIQQAVYQALPMCRNLYIHLAVSLMISGVVAFLSWNLVEKRIMDRKNYAIKAVNACDAHATRLAKAFLPAAAYHMWDRIVGISDAMEFGLLRLEKAVLKRMP